MRSSMIALSITLAAVLVGCVGESTAPESPPYVGTYTLVSVDDARLPVPYSGAGDGSTSVMITDGWFTLRVDNSFIDTMNLSESDPGNGVAQLGTTRTDGTYALAGSRLTLVPDDWFRFYSSHVVGSLEAENLDFYLSFKADGKLFLYRKTP